MSAADRAIRLGVVASSLLRGTSYRRVVLGLYLLLLWAAPARPLAASDFPDSRAADRLLVEIERSPTLEENLRVLCDEVGGRMVGTPSMSQAVDWAVEAFRAAGADEVRTETFTMPSSWREGATEIEVTAPLPFSVKGPLRPGHPPLHRRASRLRSLTEAAGLKAASAAWERRLAARFS